MRYLVLLGNLPGEGLWSTADNYHALVLLINDAFGPDYNPIFKYKLPCNPKMLSPPNGTCDVIIDDEEDFQIWKNGCVPVPHHRDAVDDIHHPPTPLTTTLYVFRKEGQSFLSSSASRESGKMNQAALLNSAGTSSPTVLHAEHDVVKMPLYSLLPPLLLLKLGVRVALRHSNAAEVILLSARSISGAGEGHWGWLVRKAQSAWGVLRPSFRYLDLDHGVTAMNIFNVRDYMFWSRGVGRERTELIVLEHVYRDASPISYSALSLTANKEKPSIDAVNVFPNTIPALRRTSGAKGECNYTVTTTATVRGVYYGLYGPPFTTDGVIPPKISESDAEKESSLDHHRRLVGSLTRSGIF